MKGTQCRSKIVRCLPLFSLKRRDSYSSAKIRELENRLTDGGGQQHAPLKRVSTLFPRYILLQHQHCHQSVITALTSVGYLLKEWSRTWAEAVVTKLLLGLDTTART